MRFPAFRFAIVLGSMLPTSGIWASTPISASMEVRATTEIFEVAIDSEIDTDQWGPLLSPLAVSASAVALKAPNEPGISVGGSGTATWDSADKGNVVFTDFGWTYNNTSGAAYLSYSNQSWKYNFTATEDGYFKMLANIVGEGSDLFGLNGFNFGLYGGPEINQPAYDVLDAYNPTKVWEFSGHVTSGATYTAILESQANISTGSPQLITALMDAQFDWRIAPLPEPATTTLALVLAISAAGMRRRVSLNAIVKPCSLGASATGSNRAQCSGSFTSMTGFGSGGARCAKTPLAETANSSVSVRIATMCHTS